MGGHEFHRALCAVFLGGGVDSGVRMGWDTGIATVERINP